MYRLPGIVLAWRHIRRQCVTDITRKAAGAHTGVDLERHRKENVRERQSLSAALSLLDRFLNLEHSDENKVVKMLLPGVRKREAV